MINKDVKESKSCNCRVKSECPLNGQYQVTDIIYKCTALSPGKPNKVYLETAEGDFKKRFIIIGSRLTMNLGQMIPPFQNIYGNYKKHQIQARLFLPIAKKVRIYSNISKTCLLCFHEKLEIINYPRPEELLNKRSKLISRCRHANKLLMRNYKTKH